MKILLTIGAVVLMLTATGGPQSRNQATTVFTIEGRAINAAGQAVAGAKVFVDTDNAGSGRVFTGLSDGNGRFSIELSELGNYTVYGSKEEDGYPLTVSGFHKQVPLDQIPKLRITERNTVQKVTLQLGQSAAWIEGTVTASTGGKGVRDASITLRRADNPGLLYRTSTDGTPSGKFNIVVPTDPFTLTVESPGFHTWTSPGSMKLNRGEVRKVQVGLRKE
jgi:hypothetical protein